MDFAAYRHALDWVDHQGNRGRYKYFVFINTSLRGPFMPKWTPAGFNFVDALLAPMENRHSVRAVSSSIVCLPSLDAGGPGPVFESFFFALESHGLDIAIAAKIFEIHHEKHDTILQSEYMLMRSIMDAGYTVESLLSRYSDEVDWSDQRNWKCNNNVHPTRRGSYDGISVHPFEVIFVKTTWCVRAAEVSRYTRWKLDLAAGLAGPAGALDEAGYRYASSLQGTRDRSGTLWPDIPHDTCSTGNSSELIF
jgi:hypothetical protein